MDVSASALELPMRRSLSYTDAVKMLGGGDSAVIKFFDRISAVGLLAVPGINLVGACRELSLIHISSPRDMASATSWRQATPGRRRRRQRMASMEVSGCCSFRR